MHKMESTPKIITIIALALEGVTAPIMGLMYYMFVHFFDREFFTEFAAPEDLAEIDMILEVYQMIGNIMLVMAIILGIIFIVNLVLFVKLLTGKYTEEQASKVYTYQLVIGVVHIFTNTLVGILYIVSGVQGKNKRPDRIPTREGI